MKCLAAFPHFIYWANLIYIGQYAVSVCINIWMTFLQKHKVQASSAIRGLVPSVGFEYLLYNKLLAIPEGTLS